MTPPSPFSAHKHIICCKYKRNDWSGQIQSWLGIFAHISGSAVWFPLLHWGQD